MAQKLPKKDGTLRIAHVHAHQTQQFQFVHATIALRFLHQPIELPLQILIGGNSFSALIFMRLRTLTIFVLLEKISKLPLLRISNASPLTYPYPRYESDLSSLCAQVRVSLLRYTNVQLLELARKF